MKPINLPLLGSKTTYTLRPEKIIGIGLNYRDHVKESLTFGSAPMEVPTEPVLFAKTINTLIGPEEHIVLPSFLANQFEDPRTDLEAELAIIIGTRASKIPATQALEYVFGYTCFNDVSQRNIQKTDPSGWFRGKSFDTFGPIGPAIATPEYFQSHNLDPQNLSILSRLNGAVKQSSNTNQMIFPIAQLIEHITQFITLEQGDIIATGTPMGIYPIQHGDVVEIEIQGIGILRNPVSTS
jgi:2-keto-4-pentenoate hydratase/2-oxohepta-3-ene-1,7-dioic acid hydratase in catechol pathway